MQALLTVLYRSKVKFGYTNFIFLILLSSSFNDNVEYEEQSCSNLQLHGPDP